MTIANIRSTTFTILAGALLLAGCATQPPSSNRAPLQVVAAYDATSKQRVPREGKKRDRAGISAAFNLAMEASESGPPTAAQIFQAVAQRDAVVEATQEREAVAKLAGVVSTNWQELGPGNVGGRLRAVAIDPRNVSRIFVGAASGGIWLTENAGNSWRPINDFLGNLSITTILFDPANPNIMFAGTGEASAGLVGVGLFKSIDSGLSWSYLANTSPDLDADWRFVNRLAIHPQQSNIMLAGTTNGNDRSLGALFRSIDGGQSWTKAGTFETLDVAFDPNDPNNAVAGREDGFISYSRNAGQTWQNTAQLITAFTGRPSNTTARVEVAYAKSRPGMIYAAIDHASGEVWRSADGGVTWGLLSNPQHVSTQGNYNNALWVDPTNENHLIVGGIDLHRSTDGGLTFTRISDWRFAPDSAHADNHAIVSVPAFSAGNPAVYFGNDGGLYRAPNVNAVTASSNPFLNGWTNLNRGLAVTQFYAGAGLRSAGGRIIGGTQDNGSLQLIGSSWSAWRGGDGGFSAVDPDNDRTFYGQYIYLSIHRTLNGGLSSAYICNGITEGKKNEGGATYCGEGATEKTNFISPYILDPNNANRILAGANSLWVSDDVKAATPTWRVIKPPVGGDSGTNYINAISAAKGNSALVWVGHNQGQVYRSNNALDASPAWTQMLGLPARQVQRILINDADHNHIIVAFTGFVASNLWETRNGGATWSSAITGNLPNAPIFVVVRHPSNANWLYVGTSVGVFASENGGQSWSATNDGPANVRVRDLFWYSSNELVAVTYGRGMFKATVAGAGPGNYQGVWWGGAAENGWGLSLVQHGQTLVAGWYLYGATGQPTWLTMPGCTWVTEQTNPVQHVCTGQLTAATGAPFSSYNAAQFSQASVGSVSFRFTDGNQDAGTMTYTVNGIAGSKLISKLNFGGGTAPNSTDYTDVWWGGASENGWGLGLFQQQGTLAGAWYTFNAQGQSVWYILGGGSWTNATTFTGPLTTATGSPLIGAPYNAALFNSRQVGTMTLTFTGAGTANMTYTVDGLTQTKAISRLAF